VPSRAKQSSSQVAWALLTEGVTAARIEAHRLRHLVDRGIQIAEASPELEHIQQVAGDLLIAVPTRLSRLETLLDRTSYALTKMGEEFLESRLDLSDRVFVEESVESAGFPGGHKSKPSAQRVVQRYLEG
jgi:hypothetical protein